MSGTIDISVYAETRELTRNLTGLIEKQIPYATALALNATAKAVQIAEVANLKKTFPTATPFTLKSIRILKARKNVLHAVVFMQEIAENYLKPFETGGVHTLNSRALLNPKDINLNQYGNIPRGRLQALKGRSDIFIGGIKGKAGATINGVWQRIPGRKGVPAHLKLLVRFGDALPVKQRLHYQSVGAVVVQSVYAVNFNAAFAAALKTARG